MEKSYFSDDVHAQELLDKYAGTDKVLRTRSGNRTNTEVVYLDHDIGVEDCMDNKVPGIKIQYGKSTHIVPVGRGK